MRLSGRFPGHSEEARRYTAKLESAIEPQKDAAPKLVRQWIARPPEWLEIRTPTTAPGERDAILLFLMNFPAPGIPGGRPPPAR